MAQDAENTKIDLTQLDGMTDEQWKEMAKGDADTARLLKEMYENTTRLKARIEKDAGEKKQRETKSVVQKLEAALTRTPKGINRDAVDFANNGKSPAGDADPAEMLAVYAKGLEMCPGVTVDLSKFEIEDHLFQLFLTGYNLPETRSISTPKVRKNSAQLASEGDGNAASQFGDETEDLPDEYEGEGDEDENDAA